jgi:hypothetical protein
LGSVPHKQFRRPDDRGPPPLSVVLPKKQVIIFTTDKSAKSSHYPERQMRFTPNAANAARWLRRAKVPSVAKSNGFAVDVRITTPQPITVIVAEFSRANPKQFNAGRFCPSSCGEHRKDAKPVQFVAVGHPSVTSGFFGTVHVIV